MKEYEVGKLGRNEFWPIINHHLRVDQFIYARWESETPDLELCKSQFKSSVANLFIGVI